MTQDTLEELQDPPEDIDPPAEDTEDPPLDEPSPDQLELEETAKTFGWRPKDQFTREPDNWVDAERFMQMPLVQARVHKKANEDLQRELRERDERLERLEGMTRIAVEKTREQAKADFDRQIAEIEAGKRKAVEDADVEQFDRLSREQKEIKPPEPVAAPAAPQGPHPDLIRYADTDEGAWLKDPDAFRYAGALVMEDKTAQLLSPVKQAQWAAERMANLFPEHFKKPAQPSTQARTARVDEGGIGGARRGKSSADLPPEAREAGKEWVSEGLFKDMEEYARDYFSQGAKQ